MIKNLTERNLIDSSQTKLSGQLRIVALTILATLIPVTSIFLYFTLVKKTAKLDFLTIDSSVLTKTPFYLGFFSNLGILLWCSCAAICLFSYVILRQNNHYRKYSNFLLILGLLTAFLTLDDLFLLHDSVFPQYLNIEESLFYGFYIAIVLFIFGKTIKIIKETEFVILLAAIGFFALSIVLDQLDKYSYIISLIEDVFKLIGIAIWFIYLTRLCLREVNRVLSD